MSSKTILITLAVLAVLLGIGLYAFNQQTTQEQAIDTGASVMTQQPAVDDTATTALIEPEPQAVIDAQTTQITSDAPAASETTPSELNMDVALSERALGNPNAPVVIQEFSSLTCGHCGQFHQQVFDQIKAEYIDTGKVYLIFRDFPLNAPAVTATMVARCLPADRYYSYVDLLFKNQDKWAYDRNYMNYLRQNAALAGLGQNAFEACVGNDELRAAIADRAREMSMKYQINSTPSFVINDSTTLTGARNFDFYKNAIEAELSKQPGNAADASEAETPLSE
jgi:protein-disulfide isomerase